MRCGGKSGGVVSGQVVPQAVPIELLPAQNTLRTKPPAPG